MTITVRELRNKLFDCVDQDKPVRFIVRTQQEPDNLDDYSRRRDIVCVQEEYDGVYLFETLEGAS